MGMRAHHHERRQTIGGVDLDLDDGGFEADDGGGIDFGEHGLSVREPKGKGKVD
jgi:hypothetical protein